MSGDAYRVDVLGPIRVRDGHGRDVTPDGALQRRLLALLVLHRGRVVGSGATAEALWPDRQPRDPAAALQTHLFRLRRALPGVISSIGDGYRLEPATVEVDADRLAGAVSAAGDPEARAVIDEVLSRWRGPAYPELADVDDGRAESARLDELRTRAVEERAQGRLRSGAIDGLVVELAALADEQPLRERPRALLMTALAAAGRTVDALRVYDDFRRLVGDELGIAPSPALTAQHAELVRGTAAATWTPAHRLPMAATSLVGRDELLGEATAMAAAHRLVTLLGPGGVGKTRLVTEVGHCLRAARPDRPVVLCELATAGEGSAVDVVAAALAIEGRPGVGLPDRVVAMLADAELVLLLDNCEHVLDPIAELVEAVMTACPNVTMLTTSRERLRVAGEHLCPVPPLPFAAADNPAERLFVERARAVSPAFDPAPADQARIREIVRRLDGLPLAIELAAARLHTLDLAEVASGLDRRFRLLSSGSRTTPRHRSLGAAVLWSYGLLSDDLRRIFADLSVFAGSFTVADVAGVCGVDAGDAAAALDQLAERSLLMRAPGSRYVLLETLRAFGAEQLVADSRADAVSASHARHVVRWTEQADARLLAPGAEGVLGQIDDALPELRAALDWMIGRGESELAGRLVVALGDYAFLRLRPDVQAWADRVAAADPDDRSPLASMVWAQSALSAWMAGDVTETGTRVARALVASERAGGELPALVATTAGSFALFEGRLDESVAWYQQAVRTDPGDRARVLIALGTLVLALAYAGDPDAAAAANDLLAEVGESHTPHAAFAWYCAGEAELLGDVDTARVRFARAVELAELTGASFVIGAAGASKASLEARYGDPAAAAGEYRSLLAHWRRAGMWSTQWTMLRSVVSVLETLGRHREAAVLAGAVLSTQAGHRIFGEDEVALAEVGRRLRQALGNGAYEEALAAGAVLDGDAAVEHALASLG